MAGFMTSGTGEVDDNHYKGRFISIGSAYDHVLWAACDEAATAKDIEKFFCFGGRVVFSKKRAKKLIKRGETVLWSKYFHGWAWLN